MGTVFMIFFSHQLDVLLHTHKTTHQDVWAKVKTAFWISLEFCFVGTAERHGKNDIQTDPDSGKSYH